MSMSPQLTPIVRTEPLSQADVDLFGDYDRLLPVQIEGQIFYVPEGNSLLRSLQYLEIKQEALTLEWHRLCWNNTKGCCEMRIAVESNQAPQTIRACCTEVKENMELLTLPRGGKLHGSR